MSKSKKETLKLIATKKYRFFKEKLLESIGKAKFLWESLKFLDIPNITIVSNFDSIEKNNKLTYSTQRVSKVLEEI